MKDLLIEIGTEELPPKALAKLSEAFKHGIEDGLKAANVSFTEINAYAAPRRLAVILKDVIEAQPDREIEKRGPAVQAAFDADGNPSKAAQGFARGCGIEVAELDRMKTDKGEWLLYKLQEKGKATVALIPEIVETSLAKLPIPKRMRWGDKEVEFVRPVHWVLMLMGEHVIEANILGISAGNKTYGHRFHHPDSIEIKTPNEYINKLLKPGFVMVDIRQRRETILNQTQALAKTLGGEAIIDENLLHEVTSLVEWPVAIAGSFDQHFLDVPKESLISSMQDHQKYFPVMDAEQNLLANFITISNIESKDVSQVIEGNERVIRPRLADAAFFWNQDCKQTLISRVESLDKVVFQNKLGSLGDKSRRIANVAEKIAASLNENTEHAKRAALLSKCDLMSDMVYEFTDLQGIMGRYYALHDGEPREVADALNEQYMPRFAGDQLPPGATGQILAIADKLDTLLGIFSIGQKPTGEKDPFALRRAALGVLRILIECKLDLDLRDLLNFCAEELSSVSDAQAAIDDVINFMLERLRVYYTSQKIAIDTYDAVAALKPTRPIDFDRRIQAVSSFRNMAEAESLAAANKRISNILKKVDGDINTDIQTKLLAEKAEKKLHDAVLSLAQKVTPLFARGDYQNALQQLAALREPVDDFFDQVMVMADDQQLKNNRLALLKKLNELFLEAADLSRLQ